jgi:multiple sugar transport system substrate-binding protein
MIVEKQRDAAIKFVSSMGDITNNITWCHMSAGGSNPVLKDVASDPKYLENDVLKAFGETAAKVPESFEQLQMLGFQNGEPHPAMGTITGKFIIPKCLNQVLVQGKDIDAAMAEAQKSLEAEVAAVKK